MTKNTKPLSGGRMRRAAAGAAVAALVVVLVAALGAIGMRGSLYANGNFGSSEPTVLAEWTWTLPDGASGAVTLPHAFEHGPQDPSLALSTVLPSDAPPIPEPCVLVPAVYCDIAVALDGETIFEWHAPADGFSATAGKRYELVSLPDDWRGCTLSLSYTPLLDGDQSYGIVAPVLGDKEAILLDQLAADAPSLAVCALLVAIGGVLALLHLAVRDAQRADGSLGLIALFSLVCGMYMLCQLTTIHLVQANSYATYFAEFYLFMLLPVVLAALLRSSAGEPHARMLGIAFWIAVANCAAQTTLVFALGAEPRSMLAATQAVVVLLAVALGATVVRGGFAEKGRKRLLLSVAPLVLGGIVDLALAYVLVQAVPITFFKLGVVTFVCLQGLFSYRSYLEWGARKVKQETYRELAYTDALTRLGSRLAFEEGLARMERAAAEGGSPVCFSVDIDNLKQVNDSAGHAAGDALVKQVADALADFAGSDGTAYRTGGDEFVVLFEELDEASRVERAERLAAQSADAPDGPEPSFSVGSARFDPARDALFDRTVVRADEAMYARKRERKAAARTEAGKSPLPERAALC